MREQSLKRRNGREEYRSAAEGIKSATGRLDVCDLPRTGREAQAVEARGSAGAPRKRQLYTEVGQKWISGRSAREQQEEVVR